MHSSSPLHVPHMHPSPSAPATSLPIGDSDAAQVTAPVRAPTAGCKGGKMQGGCELYGGKLGTGECKGGGRWADDCLFGGMDMRLGSLYQVRLREVG
nr:hypothetical protein Iba_chr15cCG6720 [Ipomoea batatas]